MKLLCIDDDPDDFLLLREALGLMDSRFECINAPNGCVALKLLKTVHPELIFLDSNMPVMNGWETLMNIRQNQLLATVPVYILSTHIGSGESNQFLQLGATGCLVKPDSFNGLCMTVKQVIEKHFA